jgi:hypothetical protein
LNIPNIDSGHHHVKDIAIKSIGLESFNISTNNSDRLILKVSSFYAQSLLKYQFRSKLLRFSCNVNARIADSNTQMEILIRNNNGKLSVSFANVSFTAGTVKISLSGNLFAKLLNWFKGIFASKIRHTIVNTVSNTLKTQLNAIAVNLLNNIALRFSLSNWASMDMGLTSISYQNNAITVGFNGDIQNTARQPSITPRHSVSLTPGASTFSLAADTFVFNSLFETYFKTKQFSRILTEQNKGTMDKNVPWKTSQWDQHIPNLATQYPNSPLSFSFLLNKAPLYTVKGGVNTIDGDVQLQFKIGNDIVCTFGIAVNGKATVSVDKSGKSYKIYPQLQGANFIFTPIQTIIGIIDMNKANNILNLISNSVIIPLFNAAVINGIPLDSVIIPHLVLNNPKLVFPDNGIVVSFDLDFQYP